MVLTNDRYTYRVTWSEEDNEHVGITPTPAHPTIMSEATKVKPAIIMNLINDMMFSLVCWHNSLLSSPPRVRVNR